MIFFVSKMLPRPRHPMVKLIQTKFNSCLKDELCLNCLAFGSNCNEPVCAKTIHDLIHNTDISPIFVMLCILERIA